MSWITRGWFGPVRTAALYVLGSVAMALEIAFRGSSSAVRVFDECYEQANALAERHPELPPFNLYRSDRGN